WINVYAARNDHIAAAITQKEEAIVIEVPHVTKGKKLIFSPIGIPSDIIKRRPRFGMNEYVSDRAGRNFVTLLIEHFDRDVRQRATDRARALESILRPTDRDEASLGRPIIFVYHWPPP